MLLVKTTIGPSTIHGIGLFAAEFIPKGTPVWQFKPGLDLVLTEAEVAALPEPARTTFKNYCYKSGRTERFVLCFDDGRYFNHAADANCDDDESAIIDGEIGDKAARDIHIGEELTNNYAITDSDFTYKMEHDVRTED